MAKSSFDALHRPHLFLDSQGVIDIEHVPHPKPKIRKWDPERDENDVLYSKLSRLMFFTRDTILYLFSKPSERLIDERDRLFPHLSHHTLTAATPKYPQLVLPPVPLYLLPTRQFNEAVDLILPKTEELITDEVDHDIKAPGGEGSWMFWVNTTKDAHVMVWWRRSETKDGQHELTIAFRPTDSMRNWLLNLECKQQYFRFPDKDVPRLEKKFYGKHTPMVHQGFQEVYSSLQDPLEKRIRNWKERQTLEDLRNTKVTITGMSLGAALANLCAADLWRHFVMTKQEVRKRRLDVDSSSSSSSNVPSHFALPVYVVTFGTPRPGNEAFARLVQAVTTEVKYYQNEGDPFPCTPFESWGYVHPGQGVVSMDGSAYIAKHPHLRHKCPSFHLHYLGIDYSQHSFKFAIRRLDGDCTQLLNDKVFFPKATTTEAFMMKYLSFFT